MEGWSGCPSNSSWWFSHKQFFGGDWCFFEIVVDSWVENCSHGLYHGGLKKCTESTMFDPNGLIGIWGEVFSAKHLTFQVFGGECSIDQMQTPRKSVQTNSLTLQFARNHFQKTKYSISNPKNLRMSVWPWPFCVVAGGLEVWDYLKHAAGSSVWLRVWHEPNGSVGSVCQRCPAAQFGGGTTAADGRWMEAGYKSKMYVRVMWSISTGMRISTTFCWYMAIAGSLSTWGMHPTNVPHPWAGRVIIPVLWMDVSCCDWNWLDTVSTIWEVLLVVDWYGWYAWIVGQEFLTVWHIPRSLLKRERVVTLKRQQNDTPSPRKLLNVPRKGTISQGE